MTINVNQRLENNFKKKKMGVHTQLFLAVPWICLQFVIVIFPDHTHYMHINEKMETINKSQKHLGVIPTSNKITHIAAARCPKRSNLTLN